jgi:CO/xanthine dehydrogenase Mo-binding subunit
MAVGENVLRKEGYEKLIGPALYVDDITLEAMLFRKTVRRHIPRCRIKATTFDPDYDWSRLMIADYRRPSHY